MRVQKNTLASFLKENPQDSILILRHGHRQEHRAGSFGHDLELTEKGRAESFALGKLIPPHLLIEIHTSPVLRCVQTAGEILRGAHQNRQVTFSHILGDPGPFIDDCNKAGSLFLEHSMKEMAQMMMSGQTLPGMRSLKEGVSIFLDYVSQVKNFPCLMISHDIIICLLSCYFMKSKDVEYHMPDFLEGFSITLKKVNKTNYNMIRSFQ